MKCVLHVGTEKTATTTLQQFFDRQRESLLAEGIVYTRAAGVGNNWRLAVAAYDEDRVDDRTSDAGIDDPGSRVRFRTDLAEALKRELSVAAKSGDDSEPFTLLMSSEHLHSRLTRASEVERLASLLDGIGVTETTVIIYLREPVSLASSLHSTVVKHGSTRRNPPPPEPGTYYHRLCDHRASIERWEAAFDGVTPRLFEPDAMVGGSIVTDFLHTLGLFPDMVTSGLDDTHLNRSLSTAEVEVLSRINERIPYAIDGRPNPVHADLVAALERHGSGPSYRPPKPIAVGYREAFRESNEWVRRRFFPEREYLFASEHPDHVPSPTPAGYDGLADLLVELWTSGRLS